MATRIIPSSSSRSDTFTTTGSGGILEGIQRKAIRHFSIQVVGVGATATSWSVDLKCSLDGKNWTTIISHYTGVGNGETVFSGSTIFPANYFKSEVTMLTLGSATAIEVFILGVP